MNRERVINTGIVLLIVMLLAFVALNCVSWAQVPRQYITSATFSEPVLGIASPEHVLGVFRPFAGCEFGYPMDPIEDATRLVGCNQFLDGHWVDPGTEMPQLTSEERAALEIREVTAWQAWRVMVPREYTVSFPGACIGVKDFRDLAGNRGRMTLQYVDLNKDKPDVMEMKTE